jgi:hypothetical protein
MPKKQTEPTVFTAAELEKMEFAEVTTSTMSDARKRLQLIRDVVRALGGNTEEDGYRRGYCDGFQAAVWELEAAVKDKTLLQKLCDYLDGDLLAWKLDARHDQKIIEPPEV